MRELHGQSQSCFRTFSLAFATKSSAPALRPSFTKMGTASADGRRMTIERRTIWRVLAISLLTVMVAGRLHAQEASPVDAPGAADQPAAANRVTCESRPGERQHCPADTSAGVILLRSMGAAPCLLGRTWGYDDAGIWVSDGCSAEFVAGQVALEPTQKEAARICPQRRIPALRRRTGRNLLPPLQLRALPEPAQSGRQLRRRVRKYSDRQAAAGHAAAEVLRTVFGVVSHAEVPLLPVRLVVERLAGRSGAGGRRRKPELQRSTGL